MSSYLESPNSNLFFVMIGRQPPHLHKRQGITGRGASIAYLIEPSTHSGWAQILNLKLEMERRAEKVRKKEKKFIDSPDIVVKVVCKYRAELFFKISRKTKLSRLFNAWTERMEIGSMATGVGTGGGHKKERREAHEGDAQEERTPMTFLFTHLGRSVEPDQTPEDNGMEDGDEILAVEMMDLTKDDAVCHDINRAETDLTLYLG